VISSWKCTVVSMQDRKFLKVSEARYTGDTSGKSLWATVIPYHSVLSTAEYTGYVDIDNQYYLCQSLVS